jgi:hypothetical protein
MVERSVEEMDGRTAAATRVAPPTSAQGAQGLESPAAALPQLLLRRRVGVLAWALASAAGFLLGFLAVFGAGIALVDALTGDVDRLFEETAWFFPAVLIGAFALGGAGLAAAQWRFLRRAIGGGARWVLGMTVGNAVFAALYLVLFDALPLLANEVVHNVAGGLVIGAVQLPVVRLLLAERAPRWPLVTTAAMLAAAVVSALIVHGLAGDDFIGGALGMLTYGAVTGLVLQRGLAAEDAAGPVAAGRGGG